LKDNENLSVFPIVYSEGNGWVDLSKSTPDVLSILQKYDAWTFEITQDKPAGAFFELYFAGDSLMRIEYRRARIRLK